MENARESQAKWYVLHTYSGYESMVKSSLEQLIENNNLQNSIFDLKIPMEQTIEEKNGKRKVVERKLLPCYVFIKMIYSNQVWYLVTNTRGVTGFVGPQGRPLPLKEDEVRKMQLETVVVDADFAAGDTVSIDAGPLAGVRRQDQKVQRFRAEGDGQRRHVRAEHRCGSGLRAAAQAERPPCPRKNSRPRRKNRKNRAHARRFISGRGAK